MSGGQYKGVERVVRACCIQCDEQFEYMYPGGGPYRKYCPPCAFKRNLAKAAAARRKPPPPITDLPGEAWLPIVGWENVYEVSNKGRVRSIDRVISRAGHQVLLRSRIINQQRATLLPYLQVCLAHEGRKRRYRVHVLVCEAFNGPRPTPKHEVRHLNGVHDDNRPENLTWGTRSENLYDVVAHGRHHCANKTHCINGHEFTPENTIWRRGGRTRDCLICSRKRKREYARRARKRAA